MFFWKILFGKLPDVDNVAVEDEFFWSDAFEVANKFRGVTAVGSKVYVRNDERFNFSSLVVSHGSDSQFSIRNSKFRIHNSLFLVPCSLFLLPCSFFLFPCSLFLVPFSLFLVPCSFFLVPFSLFLVPSSFFLVPCSLFLFPCSLFLVPCSLFLVPCSLFFFRFSWCKGGCFIEVASLIEFEQSVRIQRFRGLVFNSSSYWL